jgi:hypothetical protein
VLLGAKGEGVDIDTGVRGTGVVLEGLDGVEVGTLTLGETVLSVKLELSGDDRVLSPAVHVKGRLSKDEGSGIGKTGLSGRVSRESIIITESAISADESRCLISTEGTDGVGESINGIGVVERLSSKSLVEGLASNQGVAVVNILISLYNPDKLLARVVEVEFDLVGRRTDRLVSGELKLLEEVLVGVLCHLSALIGVEEDVVDVKRGSNKRLLVSIGNRDSSRSRIETTYSPEALTNGAKVKVDLDLVVLKGNKRKGKSRVAAEPELKRNIKGGLRKGVTGSADLGGSTGSSARSVDIGILGFSDVGELGGVSNHLEVTTLLLGRKGHLVPDVHPVSVLTVYALTTNLNLNLSDELLSNIV